MGLLPETIEVRMAARVKCPLCGATTRAPRSSMHAVRRWPVMPKDAPLEEVMLVETQYVEVPVCAGCGVSLPDYIIASDGYLDQELDNMLVEMARFDAWQVARDGLIYRAYADAKWPLALYRVRQDSRTWLARLYVVTPPYNPAEGLWLWNEPNQQREILHG